jgi:hypothetical protein
VSIKIANERAIIVGMIVRAQSGLSVIATSSRYGGGVKRVNDIAALDAKGDVERWLVGITVGYPEVGLAALTKACHIRAPGNRSGNLMEQLVSKWSERFPVEPLAPLEIGYNDTCMIDHSSLQKIVVPTSLG